MIVQTLYAVIFIIILVTVERWLYFQFQSPEDIRDIKRVRAQYGDNTRGARIRLWCLLRYRACAERAFWLVRALVAICPLLGLQGTVLGMSQVFDLVALQGTVDIRVAAPLVASAMMPALTGMAAVLVGLCCLWSLRRCAAYGWQKLA